MPVNGENIALGPGLGAAFILQKTTPDALTVIERSQGQHHQLLMQGQRIKAAADKQAADRKAKQEDDLAKRIQDDDKYKTESGRLFQPSFNESIADLPERLTDVVSRRQRGEISPVQAQMEVAKIKRDTETLRVLGVEKQKFWDDRLANIQRDPSRNLPAYASGIARSVLGPDGKHVRATDHSPEAVMALLDADPTTYNEPEVIRQTLHDLVPVLTQRVAEAGQLGGQHHADQVRGQLLAMKDGKPVLNADGSLKLNLDGGALELLDQGRVKVLADAREAAYNKKREADPTLPKMSRRGIIATMYGPLVSYSQQHEEALNGRLPQPKALAQPKPDEVTATPAVGFQLSHYEQSGQQPGAFASLLGKKPGPPTLVANHYPTVGVSFGSARKPFTPVMVDNHAAEIVGQDGKPTHLPKAAANGKVPMELTSRDYSLYVGGKRVGRAQPFATADEAYQHLLSTIDALTPEQARKAELRPEYRGAIVDKVKTAYDGAGGKPQAVGTDANGRPTYDSGTTEKRFSVIVPADQYTDAQLIRATGGKYHPRIATPEQKAVFEALRRKGGRVVSPYSQPAPQPTNKPHDPTGGLHPKPAQKLRIGVSAPKYDPLGFGDDAQPTGKTQRPTFLKSKTPADKSGGMIDNGRGGLY